MKHQVIVRRRRGKGFSYYQSGELITDKDMLDRIRSMVIPPAWKGVTINPAESAKVWAEGRDDAGRLQKIYNPKFRARQKKQKFSRVIEFASTLPQLRKQVARDLKRPELSKEKVAAAAVRLIDEAYFRVGNKQYAEVNGTYGVTTMRSKHVNVEGYTVTFDFIGKSGKRQIRKITDRALAMVIKQLDEVPGREIFRYTGDDGKLHAITSEDVNDYIREYTGGDFTAKDFRTWGGTLLAISLLAHSEELSTKKEREKEVVACVRKVAQRLGNTPAVTRASYIAPEVFRRYVAGDDFRSVRATIRSLKRRAYISEDERCALKILKKLA